MSVRRADATLRTTPLSIVTKFPEKNSAMVVSCGVRALLVRRPIAFTSLKSRVYRPLVSDGGGGSCSCPSVSFCTNGFMLPIHGAAIGANPGGVGRH